MVAVDAVVAPDVLMLLDEFCVSVSRILLQFYLSVYWIAAALKILYYAPLVGLRFHSWHWRAGVREFTHFVRSLLEDK